MDDTDMLSSRKAIRPIASPIGFVGDQSRTLFNDFTPSFEGFRDTDSKVNISGDLLPMLFSDKSIIQDFNFWWISNIKGLK